MLIRTLLLLTTLIVSSKAFSSRSHVKFVTSFHSSQLFMNPPDSNTPSFPTILTNAVDKDEKVKSKQEYDYYIELSPENFFDGTKPDSSWTMAFLNFRRQLGNIFNQGLQQAGIKKVEPYRPPTCLHLILSNQAVKDTEECRLKRAEKVDVHPVAQALYDLGCLFLDELFEDRPIQRFWFLETVARIPYFSYVSMLHLYESLGKSLRYQCEYVHRRVDVFLLMPLSVALKYHFRSGWWRNHELRKIHYAEEDNEFHHLLIMESLGGNALWSDRFLAYHAAIVYYWALILTYLGSPRVAYQFMELLEAHAVDTYGTFLIQNNDRLKNLPAPSGMYDLCCFHSVNLYCE